MLEPRHECLFAADIKHVYPTTSFHEDDRHSFAFTVSGFGQSTRMPQHSPSAEFTMTEIDYGVFGIHLLSHWESLFLHLPLREDLPSELECGLSTFYILLTHSEVGRTDAVDCTHRSLSS